MESIYENLNCYTKYEIDKVYNMLKVNRKLLLSGGIAVGKTLYAKEIAYKLTKDNEPREDIEYIKLFSLHPGSSYQNLIYGIDISTEDSELKYNIREKEFLQICMQAEYDIENNYVVIFDDINRADISDTLGDLLSALESEDVGNQIVINGEKEIQRISIPSNLYIIATLNPIIGKDKLDFAWMRRFVHYEIRSDERHFGFKWDGTSYCENYKEKIDDSWREKYKWNDKIWKKNAEIDIKYDDEKGGISEIGKAFLLQYQWDIYLHIKIMFERYFFEEENAQLRNQYMPGHGLFLTYNKDLSYGENLKLFDDKLKYVVVPLLWKYFEDVILLNKSYFVIKALEKWVNPQNQGGEQNLKWEFVPGGPYGQADMYQENLQNRKDLSWDELYFWIFLSNQLRRIDCDGKWCFLIEQSDIAYQHRFDNYSNEQKKIGQSIKPGAGHKDESIWSLTKEFSLLGPSQTSKDERLHIVGQEPKGDNITMKYIIEKEILKLNERKEQKEKTDDNKVEIMDKLNIKQMILQGPPGTSKTYGAKYNIIGPAIVNGWESSWDNNKKKTELNNMMINDYNHWKENCGWDMVQFHPSYSYEDFVRGITVSTEDSKVVYKTVNKILGNICKLAAEHEKEDDSKFFLIIDEINRADIATVFGELIYALENRGDEVSIPYAIDGNYKLRIPNNLYIIGTMNTADKSIGTIDYAIRRRFLFFDCMPDESVLETINGNDTKDTAKNMLINLKSFIDIMITKNYHAKDLYIGHTYMIANSNDELKLKLRYQILPILREYAENGILEGIDNSECKSNFKSIFVEKSQEVDQLINYLKGTDYESIDGIFSLLTAEKKNDGDVNNQEEDN